MNKKGYLQNKTQGVAFQCKCNDNQILDRWTCKKTKGLAYLHKLLDSENSNIKLNRS